ncbi:MAG: amidohydrolase [candidate division WS1 bacterium]|nr:amidohydrolase [candidate division WS1 bacterium]
MSNQRHPIAQRAHELTADLVQWRRQMHMYPEPSMREHRTAAYVIERLREIGIGEIQEGVGETGVVAIVRGQGDRCVALRADMDALELKEETGAEYASRIDGMMHACGHDGHTACLLGAGAILQAMRDTLPGCVKLLFQPGEEAIAGARRMIEDGCLQDPAPEAAVALHVMPEVTAGVIGLTPGYITARCDAADIAVIGTASHAARPHEGADAISLAAQALVMIQQFVARSTDPIHRKVVTFGKIGGGTRRNIIAERVDLCGTIRSYEPETRDAIVDLIEQRLPKIIAELGGRLEVTVTEGCPALWNDEHVLACAEAAACEVLGSESVEVVPEPSMGSEDFALFAQMGELPVAMLQLGTRDESRGHIHPVHTTKFDFNDEVVLPAGAAVLANTAVKLLEE